MTVLPESTQADKAASCMAVLVQVDKITQLQKSKSQSLDKSVFLHAGCSHLILISFMED